MTNTNREDDMSVIDSPEMINVFQVMVTASAMKLYLKTGIRVNRAYTPTNMKAIATSFTGKGYARSRKGMEEALTDLNEILVAVGRKPFTL
jgi:hypothetical protein